MRTSILGRRSRRGLAASLAALLALGAPALPPAGAQSWTQPLSEDDIRYRLGVIDAEVQQLKAQLGDAAGARATGGAPAGGEAILRAQQLQAEVSRLTGKIEELRYRIDQIAADATRRFGDIEFRLTELEGGDLSALGETPPVGGGTGETGPTLGGDVAAAEPQVSVSERGDLDRAIRDVQQGRFDQAEDRLRRFLSDYPASPLEGEARYWLGESQFVRGAYAEAARSYLGGFQADRQGPSAAENLLKLGVTLGRLGQTREACLTLAEVRTQFPGQDRVVSEATSEAERLACG